MPDLFEEEPLVQAPVGGKLIAVVGTPADGDVVTWVDANSQYEPAAATSGIDLDDLADVSTAGAADGDVLTYNSAFDLWVAEAPAGGGGGGSGRPVHYDRQHWGYMAHPGNNSFVNTNAIVNMSSAITMTAAQDATGAWVRCTTGAVSGNSQAIVTGGFNTCRRGWDPVVIASTKSYTDVTNIRFWLGLSDGDYRSSDDPTNGDLIMFRFSTSAGDSQFMACVKDGSTLSATATGVTPATDTEYEFLIECDSGEARFYINQTLVHTASSGMPTTAQLLGFHWTLTTLAAAAKGWLIESIKGSHLQ